MYYTSKCVPLAYNNFIFISTNILHSFLANMGLIEAIFLNTKDTLKASLCYQLNVESFLLAASYSPNWKKI